MARLSVEDSYVAEQVVLMAVSLALLGLFSAQLQAEKRQTKFNSQNVKYKLHRIGFLVSGLMVAVCVDPYGVHGTYDGATVPWLDANITALLIAAVIFLNQTAVEVTYLAKLKKIPPAVTALHWFFALALLVGANAAYYVVRRTNRGLFSGVFLAAAAAVLAVFVILFVFFTARILRQLAKAEQGAKSGGSRSRSKGADAKKRMMRLRAISVFALGLLVVPLLAVSATHRLRRGQQPLEDPDQDSFALRDRGYLYLHILSTLLVLWYSWVPQSPSKGDGYQPISTGSSFRSQSGGSSSRVARVASSDLSVSLDSQGEESRGWKAATHQRLRGAASSADMAQDAPADPDAAAADSADWGDMEVVEDRD